MPPIVQPAEVDSLRVRGVHVHECRIYKFTPSVPFQGHPESRVPPTHPTPTATTTHQEQIAEVAMGRRFILQGGDCAERFVDCTKDRIEAKLKIILQMSLVLVWGARVPLVRIGRIAGQYMKPRTKPKETVNGEEVFAYKGDSINSFDLSARVPDPERLRQAFYTSTATLNFVRGLLDSGFADLHHPQTWDLSFVKCDSARDRYAQLAEEISNALEFMKACGARDDPSMKGVQFFTSHEGLVLDFEEAVTQEVAPQEQPPAARPGSSAASLSPAPSNHYNLGAHFLWIGDRTRQLDGAHVEYFRGIANPMGIKVGPTTDPDELVTLVKTVNPDNVPGRVTLITRFGAAKVREMLPRVLNKVSEAGLIVAWECDPMHGNTFKSDNSGIKTRSFDDILKELLETFDVHEECGTWLGGVHFEMTGDNVTECTGGASGLDDKDLSTNYESFCDPRLNYHQSLEMAFLIAHRLKKIKSKRE